MADGAVLSNFGKVAVGVSDRAGLSCADTRYGRSMGAQTISDEVSRLLVASAGGDRAAFALLYQKTSRRLFGVSLRIVERRDWAEEIVQDAFVRIWRHAASFDRERGNALSWMVAITRNVAIDRLRRERWETSTPIGGDEGATPEPSANLTDEILRNDDNRALARCLRVLTDEPRRAILLAYCWGYTYDELSRTFDVPANTVKSWTRRGLLRLKMCMSQ